MSAFPVSGRSGTAKTAQIRGRFRPQAVTIEELFALGGNLTLTICAFGLQSAQNPLSLPIGALPASNRYPDLGITI